MTKHNSNAEIIDAWRKVINPDEDKHFDSYLEEKRYYEEQATEEEFLKWYQQQDQPNYPKPSVTVDLVALRVNDQNHLQILLVQRKRHPYQYCWALPGGFVEPKDHDITATAIRETKEETGLQLKPNQLIQLPAIGTQGRDPRMWVITNPHIVLFTKEQNTKAVPDDDASHAKWFDIDINNDLPDDKIAFDHKQIISTALNKVKHQIIHNRSDINMLTQMLSQPFTIRELLDAFHCLAPDKYTSDSTTNSFYSYYKNQLQQVDVKPTGRRPSRQFIYRKN